MNIKGQNKQPQSRPESAASAPKTASFAARKADVDTLKQDDKASYPFGKINFICMGVCLVLIIVGFLLMGGEGSSVERGFNPDIFSTRRIVVGPRSPSSSSPARAPSAGAATKTLNPWTGLTR